MARDQDLSGTLGTLDLGQAHVGMTPGRWVSVRVFRKLGEDEMNRLQKILSIWVFPKIGVPQNGWFIMEIPIQMDDLGVPLFSEASIYIYT